MDCIFCNIVDGQAESSKVYEDEEIFAFMDIQPVREGQVLVIPKKHIDHFTDIPDDLALKIFRKSQQIARTIKRKLNPERVGLVVHGYGVPHAHMVVVPQHDQNDITSGTMADIENNAVIFNAHRLSIVPRKELDRMAQLLKSE